jgi:3-methyladenine DNA glycosylase AlkD
MTAKISATGVVKQLKKSASKKDAAQASRFIKVGAGQYGAGDKFLGVRMPVLRQLAKNSVLLPLSETRKLLTNEFHEVRIAALLILVEQFQQGDEARQARVVKLYLANTGYINGWDLVDCSAHLIIGPWLMHRDKKILQTLARSTSLWERRIAIMSTFHFIRQQKFTPTIKIAKLLLKDEEDLIHKAVGWMLREVGNRDRAVEEVFLQQHYRNMPRTMLRYAIEKFPQTLRKKYLNGKV